MLPTPYILAPVENATSFFPPLGLIFNVAKVLYSLFNKDNRIELTNEHWEKLVPYGGELYTDLKAYLRQRIKYDVDLKNNVPLFTLNFLNDIGYRGKLQSAVYELQKERKGMYIPLNVTFGLHDQFQGDEQETDFIQNFYLYFYGSPKELLNKSIIITGIFFILLIIAIKKLW